MSERVLIPSQAVRTGIKWVLAGTLSLFFALVLRLEDPTWAVATAFLLMTPRYVGAIGEKMVLRIVGALAGAVLGYLIVGSLQQSPVAFLLAMGTLVAVGTMMLGGTFVPYAFYQCAYTAMIVATQGMGDPAMSWRAGMARCEEIILGIVVTLVVSTCLWPRYARVEFVHGARGLLRELAGLFRARSSAFLTGSDSPPPDVLSSVGGRLSSLRSMVRIGCMESANFRRMEGDIEHVVCELGALGSALSNFGRTLPAESKFRAYIQDSAAAVHSSLGAAMDALGSGSHGEAVRLVARAREALGVYRSQLMQFRIDGADADLTLEDSLQHSGYALSIREIYESLERLTELLPRIESGMTDGVPTLVVQRFSLPDRAWVLGGIRAGIAVIIGLFLTDWLDPPGGDLLAVGVYLFAGFSFNDTDRKGDLGVFTTVVYAAIFCAVYFVFLLIFAPLMSSDAVMGIVLGLFLFVVGYLFERGRVNTFWSFFALLVVLILVGVNAQEPVSFQAIAGRVLGLFLATLVAAVIRRLLWPGLPQNELRSHLSAFLALLSKTGRSPEAAVPVRDRAQIAFASADAMTLLGVLDGCTMRHAEAERFRDYVRSLARLGANLVFGAGEHAMPRTAAAEFSARRGELYAEIAARMESQRAAVAGGELVVSEPINAEWIADCRKMIKQGDGSPLDVVLAIGVLFRLDQAVVATDNSVECLGLLNLREAFADRVL